MQKTNQNKTEYKVAAIKQSDLLGTGDDFNAKMGDILYEMSRYNHNERGWSFFVLKDVLEDYLIDVENDKLTDPEYNYLDDSDIQILKNALAVCGKHKLLLIDNDDLLEK